MKRARGKMKRAGASFFLFLYYIIYRGCRYIYIIDEVGDGGHPLLHLLYIYIDVCKQGHPLLHPLCVCVYSSIASRSSSEKPMFM